MIRVSAAFALSAVLTIAAGAAADEQIATGPLQEPEPSPSRLEDIDIRGPVRVGLGHSHLFRSRVLSLSFEDELDIWRLGPGTMLGIVFGTDGQRALESDIDTRSFLATGLGADLALRADRDGPLFVLSSTAAPLWQSSSDSTSLSGFGIGLRGEVFPFYQSLSEAVGCQRGTLQTYVLSGLSGWALTRYDWMGGRGQSVAVGFSVDLGREVLLPILGAVLHGSCATR